ncbi:MAG TPA: ATP-binding protein [Thermoanaerobaculia bacterium]|nr:ATP-binding protein [Thermoanaerobaculia bacterium]
MMEAPRPRATRGHRDRRAPAKGLVDVLKEPFLVLDDQLRVRSASGAFCEKFQVSRANTEGRHLSELADGRWDVAGLRLKLAEVLPGAHLFKDFEGFQVEQELPGAGRRTMLLAGRGLAGAAGRPSEILLTLEDVTETRAAEAALRASETRYRRLFETAKDGILILDAASGRIVDANPFIKALLGYSHDELLGKELWQIGLFSDIAASRAAFEELRETGYIRYEHLPLETRGGTHVAVEFVSNAYRTEASDVIQCNIRDITRRSGLERLAREQSLAMADLHRRKDEFLAMLSHELRNPLSSIVNALQLMRLQQVDENLIQHQARTIIERQVAQLTRLVGDLLEVSRVATGQLRLHLESIDLRGVAAVAVEAIRAAVDRRGLELTVALPPQPVWLQADPARLEQVIVNLLDNAGKYTEPGGHIWLSLENEGGEAVLRVRDSGVGIAADVLPHVFDLFTQADRSLNRSAGGLGIGLSLVRALVELHHGSVEACSAGPGQGSAFVVRLPLSELGRQAGSLPTAESKATALGLPVLVVDDNVDVADSLALLLRASGYAAQVAYSGPTALQAAVEHRPAAVILDLGLPEMDGYELGRRLRQHPQLAGVRLIALTGHGQQEDLDRSRAEGFAAHLVKPVELRHLLDVLEPVAGAAAAPAA